MARVQVPAYIYHLYTFCFVLCIIISIQSSSSSILPWMYKCNDNAIIAIQVPGLVLCQNSYKIEKLVLLLKYYIEEIAT